MPPQQPDRLPDRIDIRLALGAHGLISVAGFSDAGRKTQASSDGRRRYGIVQATWDDRAARACAIMTASSPASGDDMKIYLAGPLFSTAEREFNARLAGLLRESGHEVWLPQESEPRSMTARQIFQKDVEGVDWAEVVVANMDGPDPDSGTCWECGYAYKKKIVLIFRTDFRAADDSDKAPYNLMLTESADARLDLPFEGVDGVATKINRALDDLSRAPRMSQVK
jgi:nucleoside 2-deoxyribosyltransferase